MNDFVQMGDKLRSVGKVNSNDYGCSWMSRKKLLGCVDQNKLLSTAPTDGGEGPRVRVCRESEQSAAFRT